MRNINTAWTKGIKDPEAKKAFESLLRNSTTVNSKLVDILKEFYDKEENSIEDYDSAAWAYKAADRNGYRRAIRQVLSLFDYMEK